MGEIDNQMKLHYWSAEPNFGDSLNPWLWSRLIPDNLWRSNPGDLLVGIGTLLNSNLNDYPRQMKRVFGSGVGYRALPSVNEREWKFYCVRGPLSARVLGLDVEKMAITDGALLIRPFVRPSDQKTFRYAFMPHLDSCALAWRRICEELGVCYIDPRASVEDVLFSLGRSEVVVTESLHGAIVADLLRIPWIPVKMSQALLQFKWDDWCGSVALPYHPHPLRFVNDLPRQPDLFLRGHNRVVRHFAKHELERLLKKAIPQLSKQSLLDELSVRLEERLLSLKRDLGLGRTLSQAG